MAVVSLCIEEWEEWKREMEENRRTRWRERMSRWSAAQVSDDEEKEEGDDRVEEEEGGRGDEETKVGEVGEEEGEKKGETEVEMDYKDNEVDGEEVSEVDDEVETEVKVIEEVGDTGGGEMMEAEEKEVLGNEEHASEGDNEREEEDDGRKVEAENSDSVEEEVREDEEETEAGEMRKEEVEEEMWMRKAPEVEEEEAENEVGDEEQEQEIIGQYCPAEQFRNQTRRTEDGNVQENQGRRGQNETITEDRDEHLEKEENPHEKQRREENRSLGVLTPGNVTDEEEKAAESWTNQEERFQDEPHDEEEESTEDEEADEDVDDYDEDTVKLYCKDDHLTDLFSTLKRFRDASLLTDLTLSTEDGKVFPVHSVVMAAVSFRVRESLTGSSVENGENGVHKWSVPLGPEVDRVGLEAVVEFAYTGLVSSLNEDTVQRIKAAAETLRAPRVLERCTLKEEKSTKTGGQKREDRTSAQEQMMSSLQAIKQLWMDGVGCDVILEASGGSLHVHRVILAVCSDYFRSMFTSGMRESHQPSVTLPYLLASELELLIGCAYYGTLPLSWKCIFEITGTFFQLQCKPALSLCLRFLHKEINPHSCLDVASFAEAYEMAQLLEVADDFVLRQFQKVALTSKFKDLSVHKLLRYLNSHSLCVPSELTVFKAVMAWIQAKPKKRLILAKELMKTIHFPLMTFTDFREVQSQNLWSDHRLAELYEEICGDFCAGETSPQGQCRIYLPKESLVLIGGDQTSEDLSTRSISRELWFGNSLRNHTGLKKAMEWRRLGEMPDAPRFSHEVTVLKGQLYVFGGKKYYGTNDTLGSVYRYSPLHNSWEVLADMLEKRCSFSVVVLDGKIFAIGGHCGQDYQETVEQYCPITNSWRFTCFLDLPQSSHVAKVLHGQIFVSGGQISESQCLSSMFQYHPEKGCSYLANMAKPRANHCMEALGERLYVAGGITMGDIVHIMDQLSCEAYDPATDSWSAIASLPVPHVGAGGAVLEGKFYVLGGYSYEEYSDTTMVHRYDPGTQRWENMGRTPGPNNDIRATVLCLPPHFRL